MINQNTGLIPFQASTPTALPEQKSAEYTLTSTIKNVCQAVYLSTWFTDIPVEMGTRCISKVLQGEIWRVGTCTILHDNIIHLMMNMQGLEEFGPAVEKEWGTRGFAKIAACAIVANTATDILFGNYFQHSLGLSGVVFALAGATHFKKSDTGVEIDSKAGAFWVQQVGLAVIAECLGVNIGHKAHLSGYLAGMAFSYFSK